MSDGVNDEGVVGFFGEADAVVSDAEVRIPAEADQHSWLAAGGGSYTCSAIPQ